jgi:glutamyl-tRNA synthetase
MKIPDHTKIVVQDGIRGDIEFDSDILDDQVIIKSDGFPTYHLAVVVDDHEMNVSHVLRGEEWISSAPKHFLLYDYFGWEKPAFFHTPLIRNPDKSKLSKRQGHTSVTWYKEEGYLPSAILNYLALMGWSHPEEKEIFSLDEFITLFEFKDLKPLGPIFDLKKLEWMNGQYMMKLTDQELYEKIVEFYHDANLPLDIVKKTIPLIKERVKKLSDYLPLVEFYFKRPEVYEKDLKEDHDLLKKIADRLEDLSSWKAKEIGDAMVKLAAELGVSNSRYFMSLRIAVSGKKITPPLNESMELLGKEETVKRLQLAATS